MNNLVLVISESSSDTEDIRKSLEQAGYTVSVSTSPAESLKRVIEERPVFVIIEQDLRSVDGLEFCKRLRQLSNVPVIMMAAKRRRSDIIDALSSGADDYVVKPVDTDELLARMRAICRRTAPPAPIAAYDDGEWKIDFLQREVWVHGRKVLLSATEFNVLAYLVKHGGRVVPMNELLSAVWGPDCAEDVEYARLYVWYLRQKLERDPRRPKRILTKRGVGYIFERRQERLSQADRKIEYGLVASDA